MLRYELVAGSLAAIMTASAAFAHDEKVVANCTGDYLTYCSKYDPDSRATRQCMENHRFQLSRGCVRALIASGEAPKRYINKQANNR